MKRAVMQLALIGFVSIGGISTPLLASKIDERSKAERAAFLVKGLQICHQGAWRNMTVTLEYAADLNSGAVDSEKISSHVRSFLEQYDNTKDFWEVMNTKLVRSLVQAFPELQTLKSQISLTPDNSLFFPRESTVEYTRGSAVLSEGFKFTKINYAICNDSFESLDLHVAIKFKANPAPADYPDYQWVDEAMVEFFKKTPLSFSKWSALKPKLEAHLMQRFPSLASVEVKVTAAC